ncbi:MAG: MoaD/ThiS family protein [Candidatus Omnitrophica bacterium]|nr:MoaD/ThiS family protein [Candidatus Omnitrophota bacterium]
MAITIRIPTPLQKLTQSRSEVAASGKTVDDLIQDLERQFPGVKERLCDANGRLRRFVNVYVNDEDIRFLKQEATPVKDGDEVSIIPAIAGGQESRCPKR